MRKLTEIGVKNFGHTLGQALESCKKSCEMYKNDTTAIDKPESLNELWKMIEECPARLEDAKVLQECMNQWYDDHLINFRTMLGFTLQPLWGSVGLAISTLQAEEDE